MLYEAELALNGSVLISQVKQGSALQTECVVPEESLEWQAHSYLKATGTLQTHTTGHTTETMATFCISPVLAKNIIREESSGISFVVAS